MGLTVYATGLNYTDSYDCGYITFAAFRRELASTANKKLGLLYDKWITPTYAGGGLTDEELKEFNKLFENKQGLACFLAHSDCDGKFTPKECKMIFDDIKDLKMDMQGHNYGDTLLDIKTGEVKMKTYNMLEQWKNMFKHCAKRRVNLYFS